MTSKVEDLLEDIDRDLGDCNKAPDCSYFHNRMVDLIDLAHAEGAAEGAERAKADIWKAQLYGYRVQLYPFPHDEREGLRVETEVDGKQYVMVPVASALAPTKGKP